MELETLNKINKQNLPNGWDVKTLEDVSKISSG